MELHKVLKRQLERLGFSPDAVPLNLENWNKLIERISATYLEADQERYLLERSTELSSKELLHLNEKLHHAQKIARLGYWTRYIGTDKTEVSKELYDLFGFDPAKPLPSRETFFQLIHDEDRERVRKIIDQAIANNEEYDFEMRFKRGDGVYAWFHIIGHPVFDSQHHLTHYSGITIDVTKRKLAEEKIELLNQQLLISARRAGMSDVATAILHNVGNILNSANVSVGVLNELMEEPIINKILASVQLLKEHASQLTTFLVEDPIGKKIPAYLIALEEPLLKQSNTLQLEVTSLKNYIDHIKEIVAMQQSLSGISGVKEKVQLSDVVKNAIKMSANGATLYSRNVDIVEEYDNEFLIVIDKAKLLQILVNLIQNAKDATSENQGENLNEIRISVKKTEEPNIVKISVKDTGVGILHENLVKIFSLGFTTKLHGHGYGLHSSSVLAKELGGKIIVKSDGIGKGAEFALFLPMKSEQGVNNER